MIALVGLLAYSNTFSASFHFDDTQNIVENQIIKDLHYFTEPSKAQGFEKYDAFKSRFVGYLTFALDYQLHGLDVTGYHIVNLGIHIINALLVYWLVLLTFRTPFLRTAELSGEKNLIALFASLLFIAHPIQTQAVTYIVQRFASLATLFYLLSLVTYIKWKQLPRGGEVSERLKSVFWYLSSLVSAILAMKTKEIAFTLPVIIMLYEFLFFSGSVKRRLLYLVPLVLTMLIIPLSMISVDKPIGDMLVDVSEATRLQSPISRWDYLFTQFRVIVTYIRLLFLPIGQNLDYDYPLYCSLFDAPVILSFLFLLSILSLGIYLYWRSSVRNSVLRITAFGIFWFFITLSVESSFIPIADVIFEHRVYLPSVGFFIMAASSLFNVADKTKGQERANKIIVVAFSAITIFLAAAAVIRNAVWQSEVTLWEDTARKSPHKERVHLNLGIEYKEIGQVDKAVSEYDYVIQNGKDLTAMSDAYNNIGRIYASQNLFDKAIKVYEEAIHLNPHNDIAHNNLGLMYLQKNQLDKAINQFRLAIGGTPDYAKAHYNLGRAFAQKGLLVKANEEFRRAFELGFKVSEIQNAAESGGGQSPPPENTR